MRVLVFCFAFLAAPVFAQTLVADLVPGSGSSHPIALGEIGGALVFGASGPDGPGIYATTGSGATRLAEGYGGFQSASLDGTLYFTRGNTGRPDELWRTDGTPDGTARVATLPEDVFSAGYLAATDDRLFFLASGAEGTELWTSDGSEAGTRQVEGAAPTKNDGMYYIVTAQSDRVLFSAESGSTLWASDDESAARVERFGDGRGGRGGFFYGTALGLGNDALALVQEGDPGGLYRVGEEGASLVAELSVGASNQTLVQFGDGALFGAYERGSVSVGSRVPLRFYETDGTSVRALTPILPATDLRNTDVVSALADGSVALAVGSRESGIEVWRARPGEDAALAFRLPESVGLSSSPNLSKRTARENRSAPTVALADGALHVVTYQEPEDQTTGMFSYGLWRDAGDGTARLLAEYGPSDLNDAPRFTTAGGQLYVTFATPEAGLELFTLGAVGTPVEPGPAEALSLALQSANPASGEVRLALAAPSGEPVRVEAFSATGRRVAVLHDGAAPEAGLAFDVRGLAPGVYIVRAVGPSGAVSLRVAVTR